MKYPKHTLWWGLVSINNTPNKFAENPVTSSLLPSYPIAAVKTGRIRSWGLSCAVRAAPLAPPGRRERRNWHPPLAASEPETQTQGCSVGVGKEAARIPGEEPGTREGTELCKKGLMCVWSPRLIPQNPFSERYCTVLCTCQVFTCSILKMMLGSGGDCLFTVFLYPSKKSQGVERQCLC